MLHKKATLLRGAGAYGQGGLVLNFMLEFFRFVNFKNAVIEANKGHLHCYISPPIILTIIIILQAASSLWIISN